MNFPLEYPIFRFLYWLVNTPGIGGFGVLLVGGSAFTAYSLMLRWIVRGSLADEDEEYVFPTSTLLGHGEHE